MNTRNPSCRLLWLSSLIGLCFAWSVGNDTGLATEPPITALAFVPDGSAVLVGSQAGIDLHEWPSLKRRERIAAWDPSLGNLHDLAFANDDRRLAIAGGAPTVDGIVQVDQWPPTDSPRRLVGHGDCVMAIAWIDSKTLASAAMDHQIVLWDTETGQTKGLLSGHSKGVTALCLLAEHHLLVSAGMDQNLRVWDLRSGELLRSLHNHTLPVHALALRPGSDGIAMVASVSADKTVRLWQPSIGRMVRFIRLSCQPLAIAWLNDGSAIAAACDDGRVRVIDPDTVQIIQDLEAIDGWAYAISVHPQDGSMLVGGNDGQLKRLTLSRELAP